MKRTIRFATILLATTVAACGGRLSGPAPFVQHDLAKGVTVATPLPQAQAAPAYAGPTVVVQPGDTVYRIAQRESVPQRALIDVNGLQAPYIVQPGQVLRLPEQKVYVVQAGDTLAGISRRFGLDVATLARTNQMKAPYGVQSGQKLTLPAPMQALGPPPAPNRAAPPPATVVAAAAVPSRGKPPKDPAPLAVRAPSIPPPSAGPVSNATVTSSPRSTVQAVTLDAPQPAAAPSPVAAPMPSLASPSPPTPSPSTPDGQFLRLPDPKPADPKPAEPKPAEIKVVEARPVAALPVEAKPAETKPAEIKAADPVPAASPPQGQFLRLPDPKPAQPPANAMPAMQPSVPPVPVARTAEAKQTLIARAEPAVAEAPARATRVSVPAGLPRTPTDTPPPRSSRHFLWPVKGKLITSYGPQPGGLHNDGLNIAASRGANVMAAENGVVAYAGDDLKGFGNLLLIKHAGGFVTAYAHNDKLLVKRGDTVKRGQAIATVGESGSVTRPQVHFQVRQGAHAVDPRPLMDRQVSS